MNITNPPSEEKLALLVENGAECILLAQSLIDKFKLPFRIVQINPDKWELQTALSAGELFLQKFITVDPKTIEMKDDAFKMSKSNYEVLIYGETGTGKELIAKSQIDKREGPIKSVNCAGFPRELIESELFGHVKGSFTGAADTREGLISLAKGGIMFLDEVGELPMDVQAKLLRVLQEKTIRKVGGKNEEPVDCKFVCASNRDLRKMVVDNLFRKDLFARISTLYLEINPLRERMCDIVPITESLPGGKMLLDKYKDDLLKGLFDLSLNVRSLQQYVIRYSVIGRIK